MEGSSGMDRGTAINNFTGIQDLCSLVHARISRLVDGTSSDQFLIIRGVTNFHLEEIDSNRHLTGKGSRMKHESDKDLLTIKLISSVKHEMAHRLFDWMLHTKVLGMGLGGGLIPGGSKRVQDNCGSSKEPDSCYLPGDRNIEDYPSLVIETSVLESLEKPRIV